MIPQCADSWLDWNLHWLMNDSVHQVQDILFDLSQSIWSPKSIPNAKNAKQTSRTHNHYVNQQSIRGRRRNWEAPPCISDACSAGWTEYGRCQEEKTKKEEVIMPSGLVISGGSIFVRFYVLSQCVRHWCSDSAQLTNCFIVHRIVIVIWKRTYSARGKVVMRISLPTDSSY